MKLSLKEMQGLLFINECNDFKLLSLASFNLSFIFITFTYINT